MKNGILLICLFLCSCAARFQSRVSFPPGGFEKVVVLPFENQTVDMQAQKVLRKMVRDKFLEFGYNALAPEFVDEKLKEIGITDGGQLRAVEIGEMKELFGGGTLFYGTVEDFTFQNLGFIVRKEVRLAVRMVDAESGEVIYENTGQGKDTNLYLSKDEAKKAFLVNSAANLAQNMLGIPLAREAKEAVSDIFAKIPKKNSQ